MMYVELKFHWLLLQHIQIKWSLLSRFRIYLFLSQHF